MQVENNNNNATSFEESNKKKLHVKAQYVNEMRRFSVNAGSYDYASLVQQVKRLFNFKVDEEIELKYKDDEDDMIIISSDEELKCAVDLFSETKMPLRLTVRVTSKDVPVISNALVSVVGLRCGHGGRKEWKKCRRFNSEGHLPPRCGRGQWKQWKIERLTQKRNELSEKLKSFGAPAPRLEAKIQCLDNKINKMKQCAANPHENIPHQMPRRSHYHRWSSSDSESSSEGKWGRHGHGQWKGAHLNNKIEKLTQKRNFLNEKLKEKGAPAPRLEAKIACLDAWINKMKEFASLPQQNTHHHPHHKFHHHPHSRVPPFVKMCDTSSESSSEGKCRRRGSGKCGGKKEKWSNDPVCMKMRELRKEKKELKRMVREGPESSKAANIERIMFIMNEFAQHRQKKRVQYNAYHQ